MHHSTSDVEHHEHVENHPEIHDQHATGSYLFGADTRHIFELVFNIVLTFSFSALGLITNIGNLVVFCKNGFSETTNITFFALSVSDLLISIWFIFKNICENPFLVEDNQWFVTLRDFFFITVPLYHAIQGFGAWVTAVITVERSLCIAYPLKVKTLFTPRRVISILLVIMMFEISSLITPYSSMTLVWVKMPPTNVSKLMYSTSDHHAHAGVTSYLAFYTIPSLMSFTIVVIGTGILVVKLKQSMRWRESAVQKGAKQMSQKEAKVAQSVILVCIMFVVCYSPCVYIIIKGTIDHHFHFWDPYYKHFIFAYLSITFFLQSISSSLNMFIYIKLSTKYKETFMRVFCSNKTTPNES
ncbi:peptide receptor gpcr [Plakobranchus ocellatus]|uniref:Peptide receptor gpcr n=1 Tax=Plakobranchus ocellatus TaxID=259542 RepID=A0AAV3YQH2_9GAST|nr:peptide receptor gpcr [Plakobranchus ocellatus]